MSQGIHSPDRMMLSPARARLLAAIPLALAITAGGSASSWWPIEPRRFLFAYLTSWLFVTSLSCGALAWLMLHHLTGADWSVALRRLMENLTRPLPWIALGFVPVAVNLKSVYEWADPARMASDPELLRKAPWLNPQFFLIRSGFYLLAWVGLAWILGRLSDRQDRTGDPALTSAMRKVSALGLIILAASTSFAAFDWIMSLDPHWISTMFGVYFWVGSLLGSLAVLIVAVIGLRCLGDLRLPVSVEHLHDLAKLLFSFVVFWAYIAFSQYFLIWYANLPEETKWYIARRSGSWNALSWGLCFGHFVVPFLVLLFRWIRRDLFWMAFMAAWILVFHYLDLYWLVMPACNSEGSPPSGLDISIFLSVVFLYAASVSFASRRRALVPVGDPRLRESIAFRQG
jgi:hypothetical protein